MRVFYPIIEKRVDYKGKANFVRPLQLDEEGWKNCIRQTTCCVNRKTDLLKYQLYNV